MAIGELVNDMIEELAKDKNITLDHVGLISGAYTKYMQLYIKSNPLPKFISLSSASFKSASKVTEPIPTNVKAPPDDIYIVPIVPPVFSILNQLASTSAPCKICIFHNGVIIPIPNLLLVLSQVKLLSPVKTLLSENTN